MGVTPREGVMAQLAASKQDWIGISRGGLPIRQLHKVEDYVSARSGIDFSVSVFSFSLGSAAIRHPRVHHSPDFISAFQIFSVSAFQICPSAFAQVFRRVAGVTPTEFRSAL